MSPGTEFQLLTETSFLKNEESERFTIFENSSTHSTHSYKPEFKLEDGQILPRLLKEKFDFGNLACKPLEEIDPEHYGKETFLTIGRDSTVHRFSGRRSAFILNPLKPLRRVGIYLLSHWHLPVLIGISLCLLCLSLVLPNYPYNSTTGLLRCFFSFVLFAEICVNAIARGVLVDEFTYLRNSWHWLDVVIWAVIFLCTFLESPVLHSLQGVILLKFIPIIPALKRNGFPITIKTLKNLAPVLIYFLITLWILVVFGLHLERNESSVVNKCPKYASVVDALESQYLIRSDAESNHSDTINNTLNFSIKCINNTQSFTPLYAVFLRSCELMMLSFFGGLPLEINPLNQSFVYILLTLALGTFGIAVFTTASILDSFLDQPPKTYEQAKSRSLKFCDKLSTLETWTCDCSALNAIHEVISQPLFELLVTIIIVLDIILALLTLSLKEFSDSQQSIIHHGQQAFMVFYVIEFALKLLSGPFRYIKNRWALLDTFVVGIFVLDKSVSYELAWVLLMLPLQIRMFKIAPRWPALHSMIKILLSNLMDRFQMICVIFIFLFAYLIGSQQLITGQQFTPFVYLFKNWFSVFQNCSSNWGSNLCILILLLEVIIGVVFVFVSFASVIHTSYESQRKPTEFPESYKKLVKAVQVITTVFHLQCCCPRNADVFTPTEPISSNGGPKVPNDLQFGCNSQPNTIRRDVEKKDMKYSEIMQWISLVIILTATVASIFDFGKSPFTNPRTWIDASFVVYFFMWLLWKFVTRGWQMLRNPCWVFDLLIVSASGFTLYISLRRLSTVDSLPIMKTITALSCCKGLMFVSRLQWFRVAAIGIVNQVYAVWNYLIASTFVYIYFLILKVELPSEIASYLRGSSMQMGFKEHVSVQTLPVLPFLILIGGILIGIVFFQLIRKDLLYPFMTTGQLKTYKDKNNRINQEKTLIIPYPRRRICMQIIHYVTLTDAFDMMVFIYILCDCLVITLSPFATSKDWKIIWSYYPLFILSLYLLELVVKVCGWRKYFFKSKWNIFDLVVVAVGIVDVFLIKVQLGLITADLIRFLRILRVFQLKPLLRKTKLIQIFYSALLRISPVLGNLLLLHLIFLYSYAAIGVANLNSSPQEFIEAFHLFKNISVSLILMPFYPDFYKNNLGILKDANNIAQTPSCWKGYEDSLWMFYLNSYLVTSYIIITNCFAIYVCEILKEVDKDLNYSTCSNANTEACYKHANGMLLTVRSPDDIISMETVLTPIDNTNVVDDSLKSEDENRYPLQISANGYIIHVEAIVSTV